MKIIKIQNDDGDTIEIKVNPDGVIKIKHSDIDSKKWGELHEFSKRLRIPSFKNMVESKSAEAGIDSTELAPLLKKMGGYIILDGETEPKIISAQEFELIHQAVKKAGGIIPNWSASS